MKFYLNIKFLIFLIFVLIISLAIVPNNLNKIKTMTYKYMRSLMVGYLDLVTKNFQQLESENFYIRYKASNERTSRIVLETAQEIYNPVNDILNFSSPKTVPITLYPTMEALNKSFGWDGDKGPMGVYWMGAIRVLAPEEWIDEENIEVIAKEFKETGPMAHEYAHYVVDYKTHGNYTRWLTEGIAQYVEKKLTGFTLTEPSWEAKQNIYSFTVLDRDYDKQANQELAYWQSLLAVEFLVENYGEEIINEIIEELSCGKELNQVFVDLFGYDLQLFEEIIRESAVKESKAI